MRHVIAAVTVAVCAFASPLSANEMLIPVEFHGVWEPTQFGVPPGCKAIDSDIRMTISSRRVDFHEMICDPLGIVPDNETFRMEVSCEEEDSQWNDVQALRTKEYEGHRYLAVDGVSPDNPYQIIYGLCPAIAADNTLLAPPPSGRSVCYRNEASEFRLTQFGDGSAEFEVLSAQAGAHICALSGQATPITNGYRYTEMLDSGAQCQLSMMFDERGGLRFEDPDWACKQHNCGMRATFENVEFSPNSRVECN